MRLILLGGPGSGKGTQLRNLSQHLNLAGISVGDVLREAIASQTFLGMKAKPHVEQGELVPDELMIQLMRLRFLQPDLGQEQNGWILEGYPRTAFQAEELDFVLDDFAQFLDSVIYLKIDETVMRERSLARSRADDSPEILDKRIKLFHQRTIPILEYYGRRQKLLILNAEKSAEEVTKEILQNLELLTKG
ncbi:nucleoside monophosphate kinase [Spirulina subsalsa FACHB-351]|uniref:Adenylate kinase n=1 Tax=Spirulina subsalsa FACHB-351 TaxID=234711 RepID=A0ABT3L8D3_9CYAN|nr:nucleoside monophosphate kinase [Spirulina subsalsa]MCW6037783.1 nucleoside monophosphate kinase [Spirulina subsalsa FACHB-351]